MASARTESYGREQMPIEYRERNTRETYQELILPFLQVKRRKDDGGVEGTDFQ